MNIPQPIPIGYDVRFDELKTPIKLPGHVRFVCSVSKCIVSGPSCGHIMWRSRTNFEFSNSATNAMAYLSEVVPEADRRGVYPNNPPKSASLFAYRLIPICFEGGSPRGPDLDLRHYFGLSDDDPHIEVPGNKFESLGYDAVAYTHYEPMPEYPNAARGAYLGCSPLSCNMMANEHDVNEWCLFPTLEVAIAGAVVFSRDEPEPGPYFVVEVLRHTDRIKLPEHIAST